MNEAEADELGEQDENEDNPTFGDVNDDEMPPRFATGRTE